jgi:hypothetical protein
MRNGFTPVKWRRSWRNFPANDIGIRFKKRRAYEKLAAEFIPHLQTILVPQTGQFISGQAFPRLIGITLPQDGQTHFEAIAFTFSQ